MEKNEKIKSLVSDVIIIVIITVVAISTIFTKPISNLDEIWNFNFARNISDGLVPYRDFNIITTPLLSMICGLGMLIFGKQLLIMRIFAVCLMCLVFFITYKILELLTQKNIALLVLSCLLLLYKNFMCIDYNYGVLLLGLILVYIELKNINGNHFKYRFKYNFILGFIAGLAILFKQTTGLAICFACIGYKIFEIRKKEDIKNFFKIAVTRFVGAMIPIIIFFIYLVINGATTEFFNYAILGVKTFSNKFEYSELFKDETICVLAMLVPSTIFIMFSMLFSKKVKEEICILFSYSISSFILAFPISDNIHFLIGSMVAIIAFTYIIFKYVVQAYSTNVNNKYKLYTYGVITFISSAFLLLLFYNSIQIVESQYIKVEKENELEHFIGIPKNEALNEKINIVDEYIMQQKENGEKVYILDAEAAIYYIPLNIYNKDYDMFNKGNLGIKDEEGIIERIKTEENAIYLLKKGNLNWQNPNMIREYVENNFEKSGDISYFCIYEEGDANEQN